MGFYASQKMQQVKAIIDRVANTDVTVLIQGENGTGKEVVARSIHLNSFRRDQPFIKVNCAALPSELLESELLDMKRGHLLGLIGRNWVSLISPMEAHNIPGRDF